jgi:hypothetical protein
MIEDEVVCEVRAAREAFAASHGFDIRKMVAALHELGVASGRELVRFPPRQPASVGSNQSLPPAGIATPLSQDFTAPGASPAAEL